MAANKRHVYIFSLPKQVKLDFNTLSKILYTHFYQPNAKEILLNWLDWAEYNLSSDNEYYQVYKFLNDESSLEEMISWLQAHMSSYVCSGSVNDYSYAVYYEVDNLNILILEKVKQLINSKYY